MIPAEPSCFSVPTSISPKCLLSSEERDWLGDGCRALKRETNECTRLWSELAPENVTLFWTVVFGFPSELSAVLIWKDKPGVPKASCRKRQVWSFNSLALKQTKKSSDIWISWQTFVLKSRIVTSPYFVPPPQGIHGFMSSTKVIPRIQHSLPFLDDLWSLKTFSEEDKSFSSIMRGKT